MVATAVVFASKMGKTKKTGEYIAKKLDADSIDLKKQPDAGISSYDRIIIGTGIHAGKPYKSVVSFIEKNRSELSGKTVSLYICCMYDEEKGQTQCEKVAKDLGVADAVFFAGKDKSREEGLSADVDAFIDRMRI